MIFKKKKIELEKEKFKQLFNIKVTYNNKTTELFKDSYIEIANNVTLVHHEKTKDLTMIPHIKIKKIRTIRK